MWKLRELCNCSPTDELSHLVALIKIHYVKEYYKLLIMLKVLIILPALFRPCQYVPWKDLSVSCLETEDKIVVLQYDVIHYELLPFF